MTRRFLVLGDPVSHSRSPAIHRAAYAELGLDASYGIRTVDADGMAEAAEQIRSGELAGANVTMPHKELAARLCDRLDPSAQRTMSVNTLAHDQGTLIGYSTDGAGVLHAWRVGVLPTDAPALVVGTGGAAKAAVMALAGRTDVLVTGRRPEAVEALAGLGARAHPWGVALDGAVVVNATPIGMADNDLPDQLIESASGFLEMVYHPEVTPAVRRAQAAGIPIGWGLDMLTGQAAAAFSIWFGIEPPVDAMRRAANPSRGG